MTAPKIGERHRECAKEIRKPHWHVGRLRHDTEEEIIAKHFPEESPTELEHYRAIGMECYELSEKMLHGKDCECEYCDTIHGIATQVNNIIEHAALGRYQKDDDSWVQRAAEEIVERWKDDFPAPVAAKIIIQEIINGCRRG